MFFCDLLVNPQAKEVFFAVWRIRDVYPGSRIPDPKTVTKERGEKKFFIILFFVVTNFTNWILCYFWNAKEKNLGQFLKNCWSFYPKIFKMLSNIWVWDPGSEIRDPEKPYSGSRLPDPGVKKAPDPGSGSATLTDSVWGRFGIRRRGDHAPHTTDW